MLRRLLCCLGLACAALPALAETVLPPFDQVRASHVASDALLLDRHGNPLADLRLDPQARRLGWTPLSALSPAMRDALLRAEDRRFFQHKGVDWLAFAGAAWQNLWGNTKRGASTLTMQVAGLLDPDLRLPKTNGGRRSLGQKWDQSVAALALEEQWSKAQIFEAYLNLAPFRGDLQGITAASELIFGVSPAQLDVSQASLLAALLRGPNARPAIVARRACVLAEGMGRARLCPEITRLATTRLDAPRHLPRHALAPHLARLSLKQPGEIRHSLLDAGLQRQLLAALQAQGDEGAAALLLDSTSGEVLAWIGAVNPARADGVSQPRLLADWWAPLATLMALESRRFNAASPLPRGWSLDDDSPNPAREATHNWLSLRNALQQQESTALAHLRRQQGPATWQARLPLLGLAPAIDGAAVAPTLLQLAALWRSFEQTDFRAARAFSGQPSDALAVWEPAATRLLLDLLREQGWPLWQSRALDGKGPVLVGSAGPYVLAFAPTAPLAARERWLALASALAGEPAPPVLTGLEQAIVSFEPPLEAARREHFLPGTRISQLSALPGLRQAQIRFPLSDTAYEIPADPAQRLRWALSADSALALTWRLDGQLLGSGRHLPWWPQPGVHTLEILSPAGDLLDSVEFQVMLAE